MTPTGRTTDELQDSINNSLNATKAPGPVPGGALDSFTPGTLSLSLTPVHQKNVSTAPWGATHTRTRSFDSKMDDHESLTQTYRRIHRDGMVGVFFFTTQKKPSLSDERQRGRAKKKRVILRVLHCTTPYFGLLRTATCTISCN